jgi:hypothetical protein
MRLTGYRRGNPAVRFMIEQTARRRMWSPPTPAREGAIAAAAEGSERRWGREFFERLRDTCLPRMAHVIDTSEGELRYLGSSALRLWALATPHATALAYEVDDTAAQIHERARRWLACLATRTAPGLASPHWGHPVYGARLDPLSGELDVVWAEPGDWCDAVLTGKLPEREWDAPRSWGFEPALTPA